MTKIIDYYFTPVSPWAYLGHRRLLAIASAAGAVVDPKPVDYGRIFPLSGGLPLKQRAAQRQAYRFMELRRWRAHLGVPLNLEPRHFPVDATLASRMLVAARTEGAPAALALAGAMLSACWAEEGNLADEGTLAALAQGVGLDGAALLAAARGEAAASSYAALTDEAIARNVFGAPTYAFGGEIFWGQDRLDFLERALAAAGPAA
ncbi:MAG: 2-hydroxychromene-2-carboxylate isomerase [Burkholderiales bacterium]|nr:2-hydroxychromene-2-carboxylate isomerase [Burkholderiales bacterium]